MPGQSLITAAHPPPPAIGLFGKLPGAGDFIRHNLGSALAPLAAKLDERLGEAMDLGRRRHGPHWPARFAAAPPWRFALPAGSVTACPIVAAVHPSADRVGRPYPIMALSALPAGASVAVALLACDAWFGAVDAVLANAINRRYDLAATTADMNDVGALIPDPVYADSLCRRMLEDHAGTLDPAAGLWWTFGQGPGDARLTVAVGLPTAEQMAGILSGVWTGGGSPRYP